MGGFFDAETGSAVRLELRSIDGRQFRMLRRIVYRSDDHTEPFVFPDDLERFHTDLASVPSVFSWLVPRSGLFSPAAALHDALTSYGCDETGLPIGDYRGPRVDRVEADRLFRLAMGDLGTGRIRRWLMWAAVTLPTMWHSPVRRAWHRGLVVGTFAIITVFGLIATADLLDIWDVLPWMADRPWWQELITGGVVAFVVPPVLSFAWGRNRLAGLIAGWALAFLLHVTIAVAAITGLYLLAERIVSGPRDHRRARVRT